MTLRGSNGEKAEIAELHIDQSPQPISEKDHDPSLPTSSGEDATDGEQEAVTSSNKLPFSKARCIALVATATGSSFLNTFSVQAVVIILPTIGKELGIPSSRGQWIVSAYALTFGCFLLLWGRIADIYGKPRIFILGSVWVAVVTAANPFVRSEIAFNLFRGFQGLGAAANVPTALGILGTTFPPGKAKTYAFSTYAAGAPLGSVFGNLVAGFISQYVSWKWVFGIIAILAAITALAGVFVLPSPPTTLHQQGVHAKSTVDWVGGTLVTVGLLALLFALTEGNVVGWNTWYIWLVVAASLLILAVFIWWQWYLENKTQRRPLMKMSMFHNKRFSAAMVIMAMFFAEFNNFLIFITYFYQNYQGLGMLQTTLRFIPTGVAGITTAAIVSQLLSRIPTYYILLFGNSCLSLANLLLAVPIPPHTSYWANGFIPMILSVIGADTTWPSLTLFTSISLPQEDQALGGALVTAVAQIGRAIGLAITTAIQTSVMAHGRQVPVEAVGDITGDKPSLDGLRAAFWITFALGICALLTVAVTFRSSQIIGKARDPGPLRSGGEEGIMGVEDTEDKRKV